MGRAPPNLSLLRGAPGSNGPQGRPPCASARRGRCSQVGHRGRGAWREVPLRDGRVAGREPMAVLKPKLSY